MVNDKIRRFDCHVLLFAIRYVTLNINKLDFDTNKVCFVFCCIYGGFLVYTELPCT